LGKVNVFLAKKAPHYVAKAHVIIQNNANNQKSYSCLFVV